MRVNQDGSLMKNLHLDATITETGNRSMRFLRHRGQLIIANSIMVEYGAHQKHDRHTVL